MSKSLKSLIILFKTYHNIEKNIKVSLQDSGLTIHEFAAMEALFSKGTLTVNQIIDFVLIPNSSMSHVLLMLTKKKYIHRTLNPQDKRQSLIELTELGYTQFKSIYQHHLNQIRPLFDVLNNEEEKQLQTLLKQLGKNAERKLNT